MNKLQQKRRLIKNEKTDSNNRFLQPRNSGIFKAWPSYLGNRENTNLNFDFKDDTLCISIVGEINYHSAAPTREVIDEKIQELRPRNLVLDLADAPFMDASGLGLIMGRYQLMKELGGTLEIANPSAEHQKLFKLAGLNKLIIIKKEI